MIFLIMYISEQFCSVHILSMIFPLESRLLHKKTKSRTKLIHVTNDLLFKLNSMALYHMIMYGVINIDSMTC